MGKILVIDIGTTSMRGVIFNENGQILFNVQKNASPHYWGNCYVEQDPVTWESTLIDIISESVEYSLSINIDIQGIAVTAQRSSLIPVDGDGKPLHNAIMWQDKRTYELCQSLKNENQRVYSLTGLKIDPAFTAPKITWLKRNLPEIYEKANKLLVYFKNMIPCKYLNSAN
jgi:sugar (pentulose or hexulose) kinase